MRADVSLVFAISGFLWFALGAFTGVLADRLGPRRNHLESPCEVVVQLNRQRVAGEDLEALDDLIVVLNSHTYEMIQSLIVAELMSTLDCLEHDLKKRKAGGYEYGVFSSDKREDIKIIQQHIDAMKLVTAYFGVKE